MHVCMVHLVKNMLFMIKKSNSTHACLAIFSCMNRYPLVEAIKKCQEPIINALVEICSPELHLTDDFFSALCASLHVLATHAKANLIKKILTVFSIRENKQLWFLSFSGVIRLFNILLYSPSQECVELGKILVKDTMSFLCYFIVDNKRLYDIHSSFSQNVHSYLSHLIMLLKGVQKVQKHFLQDSILFTTFCKEQDICIARGNLFVTACKRGLHQIVAFILNHITSSDLEVLINSVSDKIFYAAAESGDYDTIKILFEAGFELTLSKKPPLYAYINYLFQLKSVCPHKVSICRSSQCAFHGNTALDKQETVVDILLPNKGYLINILKSSSKFPFFRLAEILNLQVARRIYMDLFSVFKSNLSLASQVNWKDIISSLASKVRFQSLQDWAPVLDEQLADLLPNSVVFDSHSCVMVAKTKLWKVCSHAIKNCYTAFDSDCLIKVLNFAIKCSRLDILKDLHAANDRMYEWLHTNASKLIKIAALNRKIDIVLFFLNQLNSDYEGALAEIIKFGDESCFDAAIGQIASSLPSIIKDNGMTLLTAAAKYNKSSQVKKIMAMLHLQDLSDDQSFEISVTLLKTAVKCGHMKIALYALKSLSVERLTLEECFHGILYWSCYWGMLKLLQKLQFTSAQLLHRESEHELSPWECSLVHGHIGKISYLGNTPTLNEAWMESFALENRKPVRFEPQHMLIGSFNELMHSNKAIDKSELSKAICFDDHFSRLTNNAKTQVRITPQTCRALTKCLGRYTGSLIRRTKLLQPLKADDEAFEILLDAMAETNDLLEYFNEVCKQNCEYFIEIVLQGSVRKVKALVDRGIDMLKYDNDCHSKLSGSLLHAAVQTRNPKMVNLILNLYGNKVFNACIQVNKNGLYPLDFAFALGAIEVLQKTKLCIISDASDPLWRETPRGWFHLMITENEHFQDDANALAQCNYDFNIRKVPINKLMVKAMKHRNMRVVTSIVCATGNLSWGEPYNAAYLSVESDFYQGRQFLLTLTKEKLSQFVINIIKQYHNDEQVLRLMKYLDFSVEKVLSIFHSSCYLYRHKVVCQLLDDQTCKEIVRLALSTKSALEEGFLLAIASGNYNTAVHFSHETGLTFESIDSETHPVAELIPKLPKLIFSQVSYYSILEKFYKSLCECGETLPLAASWLAHNWTQIESQLIVKQLGNTSYAPSNPWLMQLSPKNGSQREVLVTIDWDSFSECFVASPSPVLQDKHRYTPMLVEAIVFSPVVLGQVCGHTGSNRGYEHLSFLPCLDQISIMIITAQVWPVTPSFNLYGDQATLTLSYMPSNGALVFPTMNEQESNTSHDSGLHSSFDTLAISQKNVDDMVDLCRYFKIQLKKVLWKRMVVSVSCDPGLTFTDHGVIVTRALNNCVSALSLVQNPHVLYADVQPEVRLKNVESFNKNSTELNQVEVQFVFSSSYSSDHSSCVSVHKRDTTLKICIFVSRPTFDDSLEIEEDHHPSTNFLYESLIKQLVDCLLVFEKESCLSLVKNNIHKKILPNLSRSLKIGRLDEDFVSFGVQDSNDSVYGLQDPDNISLSQVKNLVKMTTIVNIFSKLISVVTVKQRLAKALFECGFKFLLTERESTSFSVKGRVSILKLSASDLLTKTRNNNMAMIFSSVMMAISKTEQNVVNLIQPSIPAPFSCYVDMTKSPGLLFPCKSVSSTIVVQLVDYANTPLTTLPTNQCILNVTIEDSNFNLIKASSSTDPHFKTASKHLLINLKSEGIFTILWTPQKQGLHKISIRLNGIPIVNSPFKAFCSSSGARPGYRQAISGQPLIFVTSHLSHRCQQTLFPPVKVPTKHSILPKCLNALQPLLKASKVNAEVEPATGCVQKVHFKRAQTDSELSSCDDSRVHYLSMALMHGGLSQWIRKQNNNTIVFVSPTIKEDDTKTLLHSFNISCIALSNGQSMVTIKMNTACTLKLYAVCVSCHTVLITHWIDHVTADPTPCYITPGPFCTNASVMSHSHKKIPKSKKGELIIDRIVLLTVKYVHSI